MVLQFCVWGSESDHTESMHVQEATPNNESTADSDASVVDVQNLLIKLLIHTRYHDEHVCINFAVCRQNHRETQNNNSGIIKLIVY